MRRLLLPVLAAAAGVLVYAPSAAAADRICNGSIDAISTDDNIVVPNGASCRLDGTRTDGNVLVGTNASLTALGVRVGGNIQAERHGTVTVAARGATRSVIDGNIQLKNGGAARVDLATIDGNLQVEGANRSQTATGNIIEGDLQAFGNRGGFEIRGNRIDGNLQCSGNVPPPHGGDNAVSGDREGQCARLTPQPPPNVPGPRPAPTPTPPKPPTASPRLALNVLGGRQLRRVTRVRARCAGACTIHTNATVVLRRPGKRMALRVRPMRTRLAAGQSRVIRLILSPRHQRVVRRMVRKRGAVARIVVRARATNAQGRSDVKRRVIGPLRVS